ncbi:hypothetical protein CONLIGDRAFT_58603 [Coniochaeta ligniaria NRRL 30616]|uniref:SPT2-domain-containing protein n=1 Tax=Coniochaeta ligniaria NRRL 30616 TaxID=1408157 RepID=A0A1J7JPX8_9PEZI|nr:hypothetical protein CONLIGDRAFT_58603 [Coniochaeta ligniaria NRRL 30616]
MPIGDLLASITGEKPATPAPLPSRPASAPKRKAENELPGSAAKTPRTSATTNGTGRPHSTQPSSTSRISERPLTSSTTNLKSASVPPRPSDKAATSSITKHPQNTPSRQGHSSSITNGNRPTPSSKTAMVTAAVDSGPKAEPKKRSFAEIMARAKAAQDAMKQGGKIGIIQHKTIEKGMTKRERAEVKAVEARQAAKLARQAGARPGASALSSRSTNGSSSTVKAANGKFPNGIGRKGAAPVPEKKVKKAALATTGYTGTARPRPGASSAKTNGLLSKSDTNARERDRPRYGGALSGARRRYEDEDEDLDDFIEYDDDEEEPGAPRRGGYDSMEEDESDMEAGLTDVEEEERRAAMIARREDMEQEALEKRLKREKEEKKRRLMEAAKRRA